MLPLIFVIIFCNLFHFHGFNSLVHGQSTSSSPAEAAEGHVAPALYVFGDSLLDNGNNNLLPTLAKANYPPYGHDFGAGPTGRFTNGKTVADFIAEYLGLPYPPPYIGVPKPTWLTGFNYASGSCGFLPETGSALGKCLNFDVQINLFKKTIKGVLAQTLGISKHLDKAIFIFSVGNNDYINNYFDTSNSDTRERYTPAQFSQLLLDEYAKGLERLYNLGARKFVVFELGPIGCIPSIAKKLENRKGSCDEEKNKIISYFNNGLGPMLKSLRSTLAASFFVLGHVHKLGYDAAIHPSKYGKQHRASFARKSTRRQDKLELVYSDVCGPIEVESLGGNKYFVTFIDDATRKTWVYMMKTKSQVFEIFQKFHAMVERETERKLKRLRSDNGGEYTSNEFKHYCSQYGIRHEKTEPGTPQHNGVAERMNRTIVEKVRCMLRMSNLPKTFWGEAVQCAVYLINRAPSIPLGLDIPERAWKGCDPTYSHLRVFGCKAYMHVPKEQRSKLDSKTHPCVFVGYGDEEYGFRLYDPDKKKVVRSRDIVFFEHKTGAELLNTRIKRQPESMLHNVV